MTTHTFFRRTLLSLSIAGCAVSVGFAVEIKLPPETARLIESPLPGYPLATAACATCHSVDYVRMQAPSLTRAAWKAAVTKMQKTFGAAIPDNAIEPIADYLVKTYGAERAGSGDAKPQTNAPAPAK